ncbi:hypothetical protein EC988_001737, partial [Linderina pennispora]
MASMETDGHVHFPRRPSTAQGSQTVRSLHLNRTSTDSRPTTAQSMRSPTGDGFANHRALTLGLTKAEVRPPMPWFAKKEEPVSPLAAQSPGAATQRLRLPKRRAGSTARSNSAATVIDIDNIGGPMSVPSGLPEVPYTEADNDSVTSYPATLTDAGFPADASTKPVRGTRSMSVVRNSIALSASSRASLTHRLSASGYMTYTPSSSVTPTLPVYARPPAYSSELPRLSGETPSNSVELTIRLSVDASRALSYQRLLEGDTVLADLALLEDEFQRTVTPRRAGFERKLIGLYFAATWSAECDEFSPKLAGVSSAHSYDLVVVHVSADNHPADMARLMGNTGWLGVPWSERRVREDLMERLGVSSSDLPVLVVLDGMTHRVITTRGRQDVEASPLTCVAEWMESRSGLSWWKRATPWVARFIMALVLWQLAVIVYEFIWTGEI